ncbi:MAG: TlpA family protein disulfide reductase [Acidimicrobiia bacterium]
MSTTKDRAARARDIGRPGDGGGSSRKALIPVLAVVAVVVVAFVVALLAGGDDEGTAAETYVSTAGVTVRGEPLPPLADDGSDPAVGSEAPTLEGVSHLGDPTNLEPTGEPTLVAFLAHWCPHCQAELPRLVELAGEGALDDLRSVVVLTGTDAALDNHPPGEWLEREGWTGDVVVDDAESTAGSAFGLSSYPFLVLLDADGEVIARSAGELGMDGLRAFLAQAG